MALRATVVDRPSVVPIVTTYETRISQAMQKVGLMRGKTRQQVLQLVYDLFYRSGGTWPVLGDLQRALNHQGNSGLDVAWIVQRIPGKLLKPLGSAGDYPAPLEKVVLTAEGIKRCARSGEDIANLLIAVKWLARLAEHPSSGDYGDRGMRFTAQQLAEAVSLSPESDQNSVRRLVEILLAEGWVQNDGGTQGKPRTSPLRPLGNPRIPWSRAILGLQENQGSHQACNE